MDEDEIKYNVMVQPVFRAMNEVTYPFTGLLPHEKGLYQGKNGQWRFIVDTIWATFGDDIKVVDLAEGIIYIAELTWAQRQQLFQINHSSGDRHLLNGLHVHLQFVLLEVMSENVANALYKYNLERHADDDE